MMLRVLRRFAERVGAFSRDRDGSITVDFVVSVPILIAVLVITSEYGRVLQMRTTLDNAVSDAARYLARVETDGSENFRAKSREFAENLILDRINTDLVDVTIPAARVDSDGDGKFTVRVEARVGVETRALALLNIVTPNDATLSDGTRIREVEGIVISAAEEVPHLGL